MNTNPLQDKEFLKYLDNENINTYYVKVIVLNMEELPIEQITGKITSGNININGNSSVRRTCSLSFIATEEENNLTDVNNLLSINKKIKIEIGIKNTTDFYSNENIIWFPQGIFVICHPSISHSAGSVTISLSCKDKMCLLNGECGGNLPAPITFDSYDQILEDGTRASIPQRLYDIIQTLVCNYGGEAISKIFINDVPLEIKQIVRYTGSSPLYYNTASDFYTTNKKYVDLSDGTWKVFEYNESVGYVYTDFIYPGELQSGIGENVCSILDKIKNVLGNYEYFYDIDGNFVFQEIKNYLNNSYDPTNKFRLDNNRKIEIASNNLSILDNASYQVDFNSNKKTVYDFNEGSGLVASYSNAPVYSNIKNDFHIWGKNGDKTAIHYHLVIKEKPIEMNTYKVVFMKNEEGEFTGKLRLATPLEVQSWYTVDGEVFNVNDSEVDGVLVILVGNSASVEGSVLCIVNKHEIIDYTPTDWRAEIYLQGLSKIANGLRPDIYEQEILDLFDSIYDFYNQQFKADIVNNPNDLKYFIDYLEPSSNLLDISVDNLYPKIYSYQQDNIRTLYNNDVPDIILIDVNEDIEKRANIIDRCEFEGQPYANIDSTIYSDLVPNVIGYAAQETARDLLYQYTHYNETITLQAKPIYYLDVNSRISVYDKIAGISGDYIINSITLPLDSKTFMNINASKAIDRI